MQTINFFVIPVKTFKEIKDNMIIEFEEMISQIKTNSDTINILQSFFNSDEKGMTLFDLSKNSEIKLLIKLISCCNIESKSISEINTDDYHNQFISIDNNRLNEIDNKRIISNKKELIANYQESAYHLLDFAELFEWKSKCFPNLLFTEDSFGNNNKAFHCAHKSHHKDLFSQTVQCLLELNNKTEELLSLDIAQRISILKSALPCISCAGKGRDEKQKFEKNIFVLKGKQRYQYTISCTPHFKLIRNDSNYRIYFSWGSDDIKFQTFIVVKVGEHWNDTADSNLSEIKLT